MYIFIFIVKQKKLKKTVSVKECCRNKHFATLCASYTSVRVNYNID